MQGVLLRFVETGEIHRLGADRMEKRVDTRIIAATNQNLIEKIAKSDFREDLYYRLNVIHIAVPPLRERGQDILRLFNHYLAHYSRMHRMDVPELNPATEELLLSYKWPGNVRELRNIAERVTVRNHRSGPIRPDMLPVEIRREATGRSVVPDSRPATQHGPAIDLAADTTQSIVHAVPHHPAADAAWNEMVIDGKSFWLAVHPLFIERELTKTDVREIIRRGLRQTQGSYRKLIELFHLPATDYKRFLAFLYQHDCHLAFHPFREQRFVPPPGGIAAPGVSGASEEPTERQCLGAK
jgi:DNA-binding NtrC family response regulator